MGNRNCSLAPSTIVVHVHPLPFLGVSAALSQLVKRKRRESDRTWKGLQVKETQCQISKHRNGGQKHMG